MNNYKLSWQDVDTSLTKGSHRNGKPVKRQRKLNQSHAQVTLTHRSTGITLSGEIQQGNYSKNEMRKAIAEKEQELFLELEQQLRSRSRPDR